MTEIIIYSSIFVWLIPPIRQYGGKYFYYFLILALTDPLSIIAKLININANLIVLLATFLLIVSISKLSFSKRTDIIIVIAGIMLIVGISFLPMNYHLWTLLILHFIIVVLVLKITLVYIFNTGVLNLFHIILILLESTYITRIIAVINEINTGRMFYILSAIFQILIAIFFSIFREDKPKLAIKLQK